MTPGPGGQYVCYPTEGGHTEFAPRGDVSEILPSHIFLSNVSLYLSMDGYVCAYTWLRCVSVGDWAIEISPPEVQLSSQGLCGASGIRHWTR